MAGAALLALGLLTLVVNAVGVPLANRQLPRLTAQAAHVLLRDVRPSQGRTGPRAACLSAQQPPHSGTC